jgi:hypothetical protein
MFMNARPKDEMNKEELEGLNDLAHVTYSGERTVPVNSTPHRSLAITPARSSLTPVTQDESEVSNSLSMAHINNEAFRTEDPMIFKLLINNLPYYMCVSEAVRNAIESSFTLSHSVSVDITPCPGVDGEIVGIRLRDNGCGMNKTHLQQYMTRIGASGKSVGSQKHLGLGMKLVAAYLNERVEVTSWVAGKAHKIVLGVVDDKGSRGVIKQPYNGERVDVVPCELPDGVISQSGTQVDLIGGSTRYSARHIQRFLNKRLLRLDLPKSRVDCEVRVYSDVEKKKAGLKVTGLLEELKKGAERVGTVEGKRASYHWSIMPEEKVSDISTSDMVKSSNAAKIFYVWREEAYNHGVQSALQTHWGISHGSDRVMMVVEFKGEDISPDPARKNLEDFGRIKKEAMAEWAKLMPNELKKYMSERRKSAVVKAGDVQLTKAMMQTWHGSEPASVKSAGRGAEPLRRINPAASTSTPPPAKLVNGEGTKPNESGPRGTSKPKGKTNVEGTSEEGEGTKQMSRLQEIPFLKVYYVSDLGSNPFVYYCSPAEKGRTPVHELRINERFPTIKSFLDAAADRSDDQLEMMKSLIEFELASRVDSHVREMNKIPETEEILFCLTTMVMPNIWMRDPNAITFQKKSAKNGKS